MWKMMPTRSYVLQNQKSMSGYKGQKDRLTFLLGGKIYIKVITGVLIPVFKLIPDFESIQVNISRPDLFFSKRIWNTQVEAIGDTQV